MRSPSDEFFRYYAVTSIMIFGWGLIIGAGVVVWRNDLIARELTYMECRDGTRAEYQCMGMMKGK